MTIRYYANDGDKAHGNQTTHKILWLTPDIIPRSKSWVVFQSEDDDQTYAVPLDRIVCVEAE